MDDGREKHPICDMCRDEKLPTTYQCGVNCPGNPGAWQLHGAFHKKLRKQQKKWVDGETVQQQQRVCAEGMAQIAAHTGDNYDELLAESMRYSSKEDWRRSAIVCRQAIALRNGRPTAYCHLGAALSNSGHHVEAVQRYLEAKERYPVGSVDWAVATANSYVELRREECDELAKPEWWNDKALKALSAMVVRAAPDQSIALRMRGVVLSCAAPADPGELEEAAALFDRTAALEDIPVVKARYARMADKCRSLADNRRTKAQLEEAHAFLQACR